ncbi:FdtA/QdtA family cupin domain-containing protein [Belliella sp. R4-6]|uniref:FdtA/QdtA family cupin domain-containing protein n=1 Tax=Belliella alkalica TaxID=1730871 RepID=A0ABS9VFE6_9BACT|nr:FdtA/QdtA family cupin domain-containing protein [Belliella alkalica]MCH7415158.1 FdtA/QdtA family cupin domain-containing protein [Belliella alkalica]
MNNFSNPKLILLEGIVNETGSLHFFEYSEALPFSIKRSFWITEVPQGGKRGVHAHKKETQVLIALKGSVKVSLEGKSSSKYEFILDHPNKALILPAMFWSEVTFEKDTVLLVLSDQEFLESDYIRDKSQFDEY